MRRWRIAMALGVITAACASGGEGGETAAEPQVVEIVARGLTFEAPSEVPSGWTTFRFTNASEMVHFAMIQRLPDGQGLASQQREVAPVFQDGMDLLAAGDVAAAMAKFGELPPWFGEIIHAGGPGLLSPGRISEATMYLDPGTYLIECYVKTAGVFHSVSRSPGVVAMVHELTVTSEVAEAPEPTATLHLTISSDSGIRSVATPTVGTQVVAVAFLDQQGHENFVGHDVHLARLADDTDLEALERWMDWSQPGGLETPAPVEFLGGVNELPAGSTGYFTVTLEPGTYAWIAEVPATRSKGMLQPFTVGAGDP